MYTFKTGTSILKEISPSSNILNMNLLMVGMIDKAKLTPISLSNNCPPGVLGTVFVTMYLIASMSYSRRHDTRSKMWRFLFIIDDY